MGGRKQSALAALARRKLQGGRLNWLGLGAANTLAVQLIRRVFALYCLVAVSVTAVHMWLEYRHTQAAIAQELAVNQQMFGPVLATGLWNLDRNQLRGVLQGMLTQTEVIGVRVEQSGQTVEALGLVLGSDGQTWRYSDTGHAQADASALAIYAVEFPIFYSYAGSRKTIGTAFVYSDSSVVIGRIGLGFAMLLINALIKTLALWLIFLWFGKKYLAAPLAELTRAIESVDYDNLQHVQLDLNLQQENELSRIETRFQAMISALEQARDEVAEFNRTLEQQVFARTQELAQARDQAESASRAKTQFLTRISHELRTPLNAVIGFSKRQLRMLARKDVDLSKIEEMAGFIHKAGQHQLALVNDIIAFIETGQDDYRIELAPCDLQEIVETAIALVANMAERRGIELDSAVPNFSVEVDRSRLLQVLVNLLGNAIKYNRDEGRVWIECSEESEFIYIDVCDTGVGITPAEREKIFEPFTRLDYAEAMAIDGMGIGLALSRQLTALMGGSISVDSEPGMGSRFRVKVRRAEA